MRLSSSSLVMARARTSCSLRSENRFTLFPVVARGALYGIYWNHSKQGIYNDFERRDALLSLARFRTTSSTDTSRSLKDYVASLKENQTSIYYLTGEDMTRLEASPHLEGFRARGIEVLLLPDPVDSFWTGTGVAFDGKPFK